MALSKDSDTPDLEKVRKLQGAIEEINFLLDWPRVEATRLQMARK